MLDLSKPISMEVIIASVAFVFVVVGIGLAVIAYYKKKLKIK